MLKGRLFNWLTRPSQALGQGAHVSEGSMRSRSCPTINGVVGKLVQKIMEHICH